jgi:hypothetical protein
MQVIFATQAWVSAFYPMIMQKNWWAFYMSDYCIVCSFDSPQFVLPGKSLACIICNTFWWVMHNTSRCNCRATRRYSWSRNSSTISTTQLISFYAGQSFLFWFISNRCRREASSCTLPLLIDGSYSNRETQLWSAALRLGGIR